MERRHEPSGPEETGSKLPADYLRLVASVFSDAYATALERLASVGPRPSFQARGVLFADEVVLSLSLVTPGRTSAMTAYASCDYELDASEPNEVEKRLADLVDALGMIFSHVLEPSALHKLREGALTRLSDFPPGWSPTTVRDREIHLLVDSSHPDLESMTDDWLAAHAPGGSAPAAPDEDASSNEAIDAGDADGTPPKGSLPH